MMGESVNNISWVHKSTLVSKNLYETNKKSPYPEKYIGIKTILQNYEPKNTNQAINENNKLTSSVTN